MKKLTRPIQIEDGEWWFKGCIIQKSEHPCLFGKYEVFKDTIKQEHINRTTSMKDAIKLCIDNEVINYLNGYETYLK